MTMPWSHEWNAPSRLGNQRRAGSLQGQPAEQHASASRMMRLMLREHRPHCGLQPRPEYTSPEVRTGTPASTTAPRMSSSVSTLQEQMIMIAPQTAPANGGNSSSPNHGEGRAGRFDADQLRLRGRPCAASGTIRNQSAGPNWEGRSG